MSEDDRRRSSKWLCDPLRPSLAAIHTIDRVVYSGRSQYQLIEVIDTGSFGRCLVLDGKIQSSERDEFVYHESLVHPAMLAHPDPERILIAGGGEGATLREVLAHRSVRRAVMVDLDEEVVHVCRRYLPMVHEGSFEDSRVELCFADARCYLENSQDSFDVIIMDLPDPLPEGPARFLYTQEFYRLAAQRLEEGGILGVQSEPATWLDLQNFVVIATTLKSLFSTVRPYCAHIPSFLSVWGFVVASNSLDPSLLSPDEVDRLISSRVSRTLRFYDGATHRCLFSLPKHVRTELDATDMVATDAAPISAY